MTSEIKLLFILQKMNHLTQNGERIFTCINFHVTSSQLVVESKRNDVDNVGRSTAQH